MTNFHILYIDLKTKLSYGYNVKAEDTETAFKKAEDDGITNIIYIVNKDLLNNLKT